MSGKEFVIRTATPDDTGAIAAIYEPYVRETAITFETCPPDAREFARRIAETSKRFPYFVCQSDGGICGYAYAHEYRERAAYRFDAELSVYVRSDKKGLGIGRALYTKLIDTLARQGFVNLYACIAVPNEPSVGFHSSFGFIRIGLFEKTGYKFGRWHDCVWMVKRISDTDAPHEIIPFPELCRENGVKGSRI